MWKFGKKSNLGLGPKSKYLKFLAKNYAQRKDTSATGNINFYIDIDSSEIDRINKGKPPSKNAKIIFNPKKKSFDFTDYFGVASFELGSKLKSWMLYTRIAFDNKGTSYLKDIGT